MLAKRSFGSHGLTTLLLWFGARDWIVIGLRFGGCVCGPKRARYIFERLMRMAGIGRGG